MPLVKALNADRDRCIFIPQPYAMFVKKRRLDQKNKVGVGTYGLATCISVLLVNSNRDHLYVSHYDQDDPAVAAQIFIDHLASFRSFCSTMNARAYIVGSTPDSALGRRLKLEVTTGMTMMSDPIESCACDSFCYFPRTGNFRWIQDPTEGTHEDHFAECSQIADRIARLRLAAPRRAFRYQEA